MPAINCFRSKETDTEKVQSHTNQPAEKSILPPFSGRLNVDQNLTLSNENFKETIHGFFKDKHITPLSQLRATPAFPTPYVLAQFANKAYKDNKTLQNEAQDEKLQNNEARDEKLQNNEAQDEKLQNNETQDEKLHNETQDEKLQNEARDEKLQNGAQDKKLFPAGWEVLTTASNIGWNNGYFGAAYWHPEHQHVVIAHRGTDPTNVGAVWTDLKGVVHNKYVRQMESASTFAYKIVEVLRDVNHEKGTNFQVFFTGHSLGGWLAQITTFTTEYLKAVENIFLKSDNVPHSYHPHTVVFDSPGCKDMLSEMAREFDVRAKGRSIDIEHLDITSYLSAPNRVNTCNAHVGTVYRIFVDLSDMGWLEKHTAKYNLATHSMDRIVKAFDPATGQVRKDEEGKLEVQVVVDWPLSAGLSRSKEYKRFFKWAKHFNKYHSEITVEDSLFKGYHPFRYQTQNYDDRVTSISTFSQEERKFLEDYRQLCQLPEFFKPKEMLSVIRNKQDQKGAENKEAQKGAENKQDQEDAENKRAQGGAENEQGEEPEKKLQSFKIENEKVYCTDGSELQALIPYVKRLLQLFPQIKEYTKCALSPHEIRNSVYQIGTKRYLEMLHQSQLEFKPDALSLEDFLNSDEQKVLHLRMVDGDAWTGLIKVYQVLQNTPSVTDFCSEGHYTVLMLEHLLLVNNMVNLNALMESTTTPHLLMMSCDSSQLSNDESKQIFKILFKTVRQKPSVKIILTTQSEDDTVTLLQGAAEGTLNNGFVTRDEKLTWSDLTPNSHEQLLGNSVNFQGSEIALNQLISSDSTVINFLNLADILEKKHLKIGEEPVVYSTCNFYNERYYIDRTFHHYVIIKQDVLNDNREQKFPDLLASTEQEFKQLCQLNPEKTVHWLKTDKSGNLVWLQSQGSLEALRKYIDADSRHTYTPGDLDRLLEQAHKQRVMLISDTAGMGKSTVLTHLSKETKRKFPAKWVVRIDLNDHTDALDALQEEPISKEKAIEFVSEKMLQIQPDFERELFKQCCEQKQKITIVIMLDGFDKISPSYNETVIALLQALRQTAVEKLWVTTRPHLREELEDKLQQLSYTLEPFSEENQVEFLTKFWGLKDWFTEMDSKEKEGKKVKLEIYAKHLINKLAQTINDKEKVFTGIPLQCRMLAEAFDEEVITFFQSTESVPEFPYKLDLLGLYKRFLKKKYDICCEEKFRISPTNVGAKLAQDKFVKNVTEDHQLLALNMVFGDGQGPLLHVNGQCTSSDEDLTRFGIVQINCDGKLHFIHRTFAEYFVAEYFVNQLSKTLNTSQQVQDLLLQKIFLEEDYRVIRTIIDGLLSKSKPSKEVLKQYGKRISDLRRDGVLILHQAAREGDASIVGFLLDSVQEAGRTDTVHEMLLAQDQYGRSAWHLAAQCCSTQILCRLWEGAKQTVSADELRKKVLLARDCKEQTAWHSALLRGNIKALQKLWEWGEETLTAEELNSKLLFAKYGDEQTAWHHASLVGNVQILQKLWERGKETLTAEELNDKLLFAEDNMERNAWALAKESGNREVLQKLWDWREELRIAENI